MLEGGQSAGIPNMAQIAAKAGVAKITVSRALRGSPHVSEVKRQRILKIAEELGYRKSPIVSLVMGHMARSRAVNYATPLLLLMDSVAKNSTTKKVYEQLIVGARRKAEAYGFRLEVMQWTEAKMNSRRLDNILKTRSIQGLLINRSFPGKLNLSLSWQGLTAVTMGGLVCDAEGWPHIHSDISWTVNKALEELTQRGYQRIGFVGQPKMNETLLNLFRANIYLYQADIDPQRRVQMLARPEDGNDTMVIDWFMREKPDAIVCPGAAPLAVLKKIGKRPPEDFGFVNCGGAGYDSGQSGVRMDRGLIAQTGVEIVAKNVLTGNFGMPEIPIRIVIQGSWVEGNTLRSKNL